MFGEPKIDQLQVPLICEHHVFTLQISENDLFLVKRTERLNKLASVKDEPLLRHDGPLLLNHCVESASWQVLKDEADVFSVSECLEQLHNPPGALHHHERAFLAEHVLNQFFRLCQLTLRDPFECPDLGFLGHDELDRPMLSFAHLDAHPLVRKLFRSGLLGLLHIRKSGVFGQKW